MPLPAIVLGSDGIRTTRLGFGCAGIFRLASPSQRARLLDTAYETGIRHFDVAPMYGLGRAELELGKFARRRRGELVIATKFGISPRLIACGLGYIQGPLRRAISAKPIVHEKAKSHGAAQTRALFEKSGYDASGARRSLRHSLRVLNTDYLDLFLLHDPVPGSVRSDEVRSFLEAARTAGTIRSWGIAGDLATAGAVARSFDPDVPVLQVRDDIFLRSLVCETVGGSFITFGAISGALAPLVHHVTSTDATRLLWKSVIGEDCGHPGVAASFLLQAALRANSSGVVLFSTTSPSHIRSAVTTSEHFHSSDGAPLDAFLKLVDNELPLSSDTERECH